MQIRYPMIASKTAENTFFSLEPTNAFLIIFTKPTGGCVAILECPAINNRNKIMQFVMTSYMQYLLLYWAKVWVGLGIINMSIFIRYVNSWMITKHQYQFFDGPTNKFSCQNQNDSDESNGHGNLVITCLLAILLPEQYFCPYKAINHDSIYIYPRESYQSSLQNYLFADFQQDTYQQLLEETVTNYTVKNKEAVKAIRCGFKQFYARVSSNLYTTALKYMAREKNMLDKKFNLVKDEEEVRIQALKGNNPQRWPESIKEFIKELNNLPWLAFLNDSELFLSDFIDGAKNAIVNHCKKAKIVENNYEQSFKDILLLQIQAFLGVILRTNNQSFILEQLKFIFGLTQYIQISTQLQTRICDHISRIFNTFFNSIPQQPSSKYHYPESLWNKDSFLIMKKKHFQKFNGLAFYSITTDGKYLYIYISAVNGGMFKVGTGNEDTKAGKVYFEKEINFPIGTKVDQVNWVYVKGKLYLKTSSKDPWLLEVYNPQTFSKQGNIQLFCPSLFGQQSLINLNKNTPILTDGTNLFCLGSRIKIQKSSQPEKVVEQKSKSQEKPQEQQKQGQDKKNDKKKKKPKKNEGPQKVQEEKNQNYQKVLQIVLYQFSLDGKVKQNYEDIDEKDIEQLYDSFSGYFTKDQCKRAFALNDYDLAETCQWLFNEGQKQKEKNIKIYQYKDYSILLEAQITSNFQQKNIKGIAQIVTKEGSILTINNLFESIWTMDKQHITCYSQNGVKIFSRNKADFKINADTKLGNTLLKTLQSKFPKNPQYNIIYDPYNALFYTFAWPQDGHYFPAAILTSNDKKHVIKSQEQKKFNAEIENLTSLKQMSKFALHHMNLLDKSAIKNRYRFNDWLWFYGQRIVQINNEMNQAESDKKRLSNKRTKVMTKLNKINEIEKRFEKDKALFTKNNKVTKEIIKIYPFDSEGDVKNYRLIVDAFKNITDHPQQVYLYVLCLQNWLGNSPSCVNQQIKGILIQIGQNLFRLKELSNGKNRTYINRLILQQFYLFYPTLERQIKFIVTLNEEELKDFIKSQSIVEKRQKQSIIYEITKKEHLIQKYETAKCDFSEVFKSKSTININEGEDIELIGNLLLTDIVKIQNQKLSFKNKYDDNLKKSLLEYLQQKAINSSLGNRFIELLFLNSFKLINTNTKDLQLSNKYLSELFTELFKLYEKILSKSKAQQLTYIIPTFLMIVQLYHGSLIPLVPNQEIINSLLKSIEYIQKPQFNQILTFLQESQYEGISPTTEKLYQTSHPLQRGKNYNFSPRYFPNASLILLDLDKKCQSDPNNDTLNIQILHQDTAVGNNIQVNDGVFSSYLRLSGSVDTKKPYLIFGNSISVDFNSSGQVKDTQSLVRYGFKFGLRPIFGGKIKYNQSKKQKIEKVFGNINSFQAYINTLKFTTIAISNTIQNYLSLQSKFTDSKISELLKNKIFKEGFQQNSYKFENRRITPYQHINQFMKKTELDTQDKVILQSSHQNYWKVQQSPNAEVPKEKESLWNFEGVPSSIKGYLQQIQQFKGDFINVFTEARQLAKEKGSYAHMMRKKTFQNKHKQFWLQGEAILFLTILKHSGLLHLNLKFSIEYIKENLRAFEDARDGIYYSFISRIQNVNEWRDLLETYIGKEEEIQEKKEEPEEKKGSNINISIKRKGKTVKSMKIGEQKAVKKEKEKVEEKPVEKGINRVQFEKIIRERLSNNDSLIKGICNLKKIRYEQNNQFETIGRIIDQIIKASQRPIQAPQTVYTQPIQHLIRCCLFLLKFKSPSTKETLESNEDIVPLNMARSLSSDNRNVNTNKLNIFREWLQNWKKWKGFKKQGRIQLRFPVEEIVKYINSWVNLTEIEQVIRIRFYQCENRIQFYSNTSHLLKIFANSSLIKYALGTEALNLHKTYHSSLSSINQSKLKELQQTYSLFQNNLKTIEGNLIQKLPLKFSKIESLLKDKNHNFLQKIKILLHIIFLLQNQNPQINLQLILYFIPFKHLSNKHEDITYLTNLLSQKAFISQHSNATIIPLLEKEVGKNNICYKRWKDLFFIERVLFLLKKLEINCRKKTTHQQKIKISELLFFILYHIEVPIISRVALKIIKKLNINLKQGIKTPFDYEYKLYAENQKRQVSLKETFTLRGNNKNNIELLCSKVNRIFQSSYTNQLQQKFEEPIEEKLKEDERYNIILNLHQEEDLYWLIKAMYYIDQLEKKNGEKTIHQIKDWQEYLTLKGKKRQDKREQQPANNNNENDKDKKSPEKRERIFINLPKYSKIDANFENDLPLGWYFNYCNVFGQAIQKSHPPISVKVIKSSNNINALQNALKNARSNKNNNNNNNNRKAWNTPIFTRLAKKYEEFNSKPIEEPKQGDTPQVKSEFVKAKNIFNRIRKYFVEISILIDNFARTGYYLFREDISLTRMNQICQLITAGSSNRLKDLTIDLKNNDVKNRLTVNDFVPNFTSKMKITIIKTKYYSLFDNLLSYQSLMASKQDTSSINLIARKQLAMQDSKAFTPFEEFIPFDQSAQTPEVEFGKQWIQSNFSRMKKKNEKVYLNDYPNNTFYIGQGGIQSGIKQNILVPSNDSSLTLQTTSFQKILSEPRSNQEKQYQQTQYPEQLIEKIEQILLKGSITIQNKSDIKQFLLLTFYLQKLNHFDLQFVSKDICKKFTQKLFNFTSNLNSYKELSQYQEDTQKLILKLIDNQHQKLHLFANYINDQNYNTDVQEYFVPLKLQKLNSSNQVKQQTLQTHSYIKSKYLLKSQPPQIQQNKLLKYWQKNILPKIYEFVKTTLKQIEIQDFWEQMRRPLRIGDHTDAKRVAYIICDNKLPAGAVIPDANHNWNSLEIQEIFVGENVLVKLPRHRGGQFSTPLLSWGYQEKRLAKIVFIDVKNSSVLIRYRVEELALFSYAWVPINALMAVQKQVMHISTKNIYEQLQKKLEGMVYINAKQCLTKLALTVSEVDNLKLLKETILDLFIKNPISGCFDFPKPTWSMRPIFQKMLEDNNYTLIQILEKQFCTIRGFDLNLNSEKIINLNRFDDAKALIVSFKKDAKLSQCSGIRFFNDKYGYNEVSHVYTAKSERTDIEPIQFNDPNIYSAFYNNKECLSIIEQNNYKVHPIEATVFAIDDMWTIGCYIGEVLCEIATSKPNPSYLEILQRLNTVFIKWILKKSVSVLCTYLAKQIYKICMTVSYLCEKNNIQPSLQKYGLNLDQFKQLIKWINQLTDEQSKAKVALYSALLQNLSEMVSAVLFKLPNNFANSPEHIKSSVQLLKIFKEIDYFIKTKKLTQLIPNSSAPSYQWERILQISNIPNYFDNTTIFKKMKEIIQQNKGKILCPAFDIYLSDGNCFILVQGWDINELIEEEVIEKIEQEEQKQQQAQQEVGMMSWICEACTYQNPAALNICDICQSPAPVVVKQEEVYDVVQATDLKAAERKLKQRQSKRFEEVKVQILKFFEDQYKLACELVEKKNKEIEDSNKNKQIARKNKKGGELVKEQLIQLPKKPQIKLQTGSSIFQNPSIQSFLKARYQALPQELRKLVELQEISYLAKFKKFLSLGYDLWGDNISNENSTLIPFNLLYMLMDYIQSQICKGSSSVLSYSQQSIRIISQIPLLDASPNEEPVNYASQNDMGVRVKYKALGALKSYNIRYSWKFVKELNLAASKCLQFVNMDLKFDKDRNDTSPVYNDSLGYYIKYFRNLIMGVIKLQLFQKIMQKTSVARQNDEVPRVQLERLKSKEERIKEGLVTLKQKEDHLFTKAHSQFLKISPAFLRPFKPKGADPYLSFTVTFKGENVMGQAGPYRQFFTDIGRELTPTYNLGLFMPSPNNRHQSGQHKSKWVINPKANSTYHFSLFQFIGTLMGCCFRTGGHLALDLPTMFWKSITHQEVTDVDLQQVDSQLVSMIKMLKDCPSQEALIQATDATNGGPLTWTYRSYDDQIHEMKHNGKNIHVQFKDINQYIDTLRLKKINQSKLQIKRIVQGISQLIPRPYLHCLTGEELKLIICGRPKVDVDLLKKHTKYSGGLTEQSRRIKFFWEIMKELPEIDRLKIIRFCWGQQRLPINSQQFQRNNIRFMIKPMIANHKIQDQALPKADTCFFNIQLPDYSTKVIMREKILLAVNLDNVSINADQNMMNNQDNPLMNELNSYDQQEDYEEQ